MAYTARWKPPAPMRRVVMSDALEAIRAEVERAKAAGIDRGFGNRLTEIAVRYDAIVRHASPRADFSDREWRLLTEVLLDHWPTPDLAATPAHLGEILTQAGEQLAHRDGDRATKIKALDIQAMANRIKAFDLVETVALLEAIYRDIVAGITTADDTPEMRWRIEIKRGGGWETLSNLNIPALGFDTKKEAQDYIAMTMAHVTVPLRVVGAEV